MKKFMFFVVCLTAICFVSLTSLAQSLESTIDDEYSEVETAAANLWQRSLPLNHLDNPNLIYPGNTLTFAFPDVEDRFIYPVRKGDEGLKISKRLITGDYFFESKTPKVSELPRMMPGSEKVYPVVTYSNFDWTLFLVIICLVAVFLLVASIKFYNLWMASDKKNKEAKDENQNLRYQNFNLESKIKELKNKLPIEAPAVVDEVWLANNHPVNSAVESLDQLVFSGNKVQGQKPDLIAKVLVSTSENAVNMDFSYGRKAQTGLNNVPIFLGWNWDNEKHEWIEVGMIATICSNGFQVSPEKIMPISELFTKFDLISPEERPIVYEANLEEDVKYPAMIRPLMIKYHKANIADLNKAGAVVIPKRGMN